MKKNLPIYITFTLLLNIEMYYLNLILARKYCNRARKLAKFFRKTSKMVKTILIKTKYLFERFWVSDWSIFMCTRKPKFKNYFDFKCKYFGTRTNFSRSSILYLLWISESRRTNRHINIYSFCSSCLYGSWAQTDTEREKNQKDFAHISDISKDAERTEFKLFWFDDYLSVCFSFVSCIIACRIEPLYKFC